jgi:hypothetical protein
MNTPKCSICLQDSTTLTTYRVEHLGAEVHHWTCDRDTGRLRSDMVEAGWTVAA